MFRRWRKSKDDDPFRPLSEQEQELVEHDVAEQSAYGEPARDATPDSPVNADDVSGLDLPLTPGEREVAQQDVDDELGRT